jgi:hypothetical protein
MSERAKLFLAPCANSNSQDHFEKAVLNGISEETYGSTTEYQLGGKTAVWGVSEGNSGSWRKINQGDIVLFYFGEWKYKYSAKVVYKDTNQELAELIWDQDHFQKSWDHLIYLKEITEVDIDSRELHQFADYERMFPYHFMTYRENGMENIIKEFGSIEDYIANNNV